MTAATLTLHVGTVDDSVPGVRSLTLVRPDGGPLPSYTPGSHLVVHCEVDGGTRANAYSLTGEPRDPEEYAVSVLLLPDGGGGSAWVHGLRPGDPVQVTPPRSAFAPVQRAARHLLIGAGIGVTPLLSHLRWAVRWGRDLELLYLHRPGSGTHLDELRCLGGERVALLTDRLDFVDHLAAALARQPVGTHLYTCGPQGFMELVVDTAVADGWPASRIHLEHFGIDALDPGEPFEVRVRTDGQDAGRSLPVPSGVSLLEALEQEGYAVPSLCRQGVCGECRIGVAAGKVMHRDLFLGDDEKADGDAMMACVSRAADTHLEVTL
jgi:ferredoxin-NADP reductase